MRNELTIELRGDAAQRPPQRLAVSARQPRLGLGPIALRARRAANARFVVASAPLDAPGTWEVTVSGDGERPRDGAAASALSVRRLPQGWPASATD